MTEQPISLVDSQLSFVFSFFNGLYLKKKKDYLFIFGCAGSLLLCGVFSNCSEGGLLSSCGAQASHCSSFSCCRAQALGVQASIVTAHGLSSYGSQALGHRLNSCGAWA